VKRVRYKKDLGGIKMEKRKLLTVVLFCIGLAGIVAANEVINVDLNAQDDNDAYTGEAAYPGDVWRAVYEGWGIAVGSARTANLRDYDEPNLPSTYAAQVWLGIPEDGLFNKVDDGTSDNAMMDDGFRIAGVKDPCVYIIGEPQDGSVPSGAYSGTFDIYVYSNAPTHVTLKSPDIGSNTQYITGAYVGGPLQTPQNYVIFQDVVIDDGNTVPASETDPNLVEVPGDANTVTIVWDNIINGLQLVKQKSPIEVEKGLEFFAADYDVAYELNHAGPNELQPFGPDITTDANRTVTILGAGEYMIYDLSVADGNDGFYQLDAKVDPVPNNNMGLQIYYKDVHVGDLSATYDDTKDPNLTYWMTEELAAPELEFNIFAGDDYTLRWTPTSNRFFGLSKISFWNKSGAIRMDNCSDVYFYGFNYMSDYTGDCIVDGKDLDMILEHWAECYSPDPCDCN
jgi:hypothetical protein